MNAIAARGSRPQSGTPAEGPLAMELREAALRMAHLYWSRRFSTDESSSNRLVGLLYVDTNG
jgi:hypothetical protein